MNKINTQKWLFEDFCLKSGHLIVKKGIKQKFLKSPKTIGLKIIGKKIVKNRFERGLKSFGVSKTKKSRALK